MIAEETPQFVISKRDALVDAVVESGPELSEALMSYHDVRTQNDENEKEVVLKTIADCLEDLHKSKYYKGTIYAGLEDSVFTIFKKSWHSSRRKSQWKLRKSERMKLYNKTFKAAIDLLQKEDVDEFQTAEKDYY